MYAIRSYYDLRALRVDYRIDVDDPPAGYRQPVAHLAQQRAAVDTTKTLVGIRKKTADVTHRRRAELV